MITSISSVPFQKKYLYSLPRQLNLQVTMKNQSSKYPIYPFKKTIYLLERMNGIVERVKWIKPGVKIRSNRAPAHDSNIAWKSTI